MAVDRRTLNRRSVETAKEIEGLRLIKRLINEISQGRNLDDILNVLFQNLGTVIPTDRIGLAQLDEQKRKLVLTHAKSTRSMVLKIGYGAMLEGSTLKHVIEHKTPRIINDLELYLQNKPESQSTRLIVKEGMRSSLTLPLVCEDRAVGVIFFSSVNKNAYKQEHADFLSQIAGIISYIIEKNALLERLMEVNSYLESILENSADAIMVISADNIIKSWNEGAKKLFGYSPDEIIGQSVEVLVPDDVQVSDVRTIQKMVEEEGYVSGYETVRKTKDGRKITVSVTSTLLRDKTGAVTGRSSIVRDVTKLKLLEQQNLQKQRLAAIGEMATVVAHEVKNPLAGISGAIDVLGDTFDARDERKQIVAEIKSLVGRLDRIVRELLIYSKPYQLNKIEVDICELFSRIIFIFDGEAASRRVTINKIVPMGERLYVDPVIVEQILTNLVKNSLEAVANGGVIDVYAENRGSTFYFSVTDNGPGIRESDIERVFAPFYTTKTVGTGLGLPICQKMASLHGGFVKLSSIEGKGTKVEVILGLL